MNRFVNSIRKLAFSSPIRTVALIPVNYVCTVVNTGARINRKTKDKVD
jgi:hypothetical protein